jgi:hypothetical protein
MKNCAMQSADWVCVPWRVCRRLLQAAFNAMGFCLRVASAQVLIEPTALIMKPSMTRWKTVPLKPSLHTAGILRSWVRGPIEFDDDVSAGFQLDLGILAQRCRSPR